MIRCIEQDEQTRQLVHEKKSSFAPFSTVLALTDTAAGALKEVAPFLSSLERKGRITIYGCRNFACELPQVIE